jgi:2-polyprenyl-6-methoxyphenol hydroxylase-like FAD-dependent oxidoreductase
MNDDHRDVVILGAGVGGLFLALLLGRAGRRVVVLERRGELGSRGAEFLKPRGLRLLHSVGLADELHDRGAWHRSLIRYYHDGRLLLQLDFERHTELGHYLILPYHDIVRALAGACNELDSVELWFNASVLGADQAGDDVQRVYLADGRRLDADAFVIADAGTTPLGSWAPRRAHASAPPHTMFMATLPLLRTAAEHNRLYFSSDGWLAYMYPVGDASTRLFVGVPSGQEHLVVDRPSVELADRLATFVSASPDALMHLRTAGTVGLQRMPLESRQVERYHHGNVALLGSSAWMCHPMTGQGMSYTMEDAEVLAGAIHDALDGRGALDALLERRYEPRGGQHRQLIDYGDALARSYPDRDAYLRCFDAAMHGGDVAIAPATAAASASASAPAAA